MPKRKKAERFALVGEKDCWHSYSLQGLTPTRFAVVVGKILRGNYALSTSKFDRQVQQSYFV